MPPVTGAPSMGSLPPGTAGGGCIWQPFKRGSTVKMWSMCVCMCVCVYWVYNGRSLWWSAGFFFPCYLFYQRTPLHDMCRGWNSLSLSFCLLSWPFIRLAYSSFSCYVALLGLLGVVRSAAGSANVHSIC